VTEVAVLDLGSNTVKITVAQVDGDGIRILDERVRATRIVEGRRGPNLDPAAVKRTLAAIEALSADLPEVRFGVATASLRGAAARAEIIAALHRRTGFEVEVISGTREAELGFLGPQTLFGSDLAISFDVGGKSTEVSGLSGGRWRGQSHSIGALSAADGLPDPPGPREREEMKRRCEAALADIPDDWDPGRLVGVSGTALAILGIDRGVFALPALLAAHDGGRVGAADLDAMIASWAQMTAAERVREDLIPPLRADALIGGMVLVRTLLARLKRDHFHVTPRGVRHGLLVELQRKTTGSQ